MQFTDLKQSEEPSLNLAPFIDVVFILLMFFILMGSSVHQEKMLDIQLPQTQSGKSFSPGTVTLQITEKGELYWNDSLITWDTLSESLKKLSEEDKEALLYLRVDKTTRYDAVLQMIDLAKQMGMEHIYLGALSAPKK